MKNVILATAVILGALALTACQSTSNSPAPYAATSCMNGYYPAMNGQNIPCSPTGITGMGGTPISGIGYGYGGTTGGCTMYNTPGSPLYIGQGAYYVPMIDPTSGQPECVNIGYTNYTTLVNYGWDQSSPIYGCSSYYSGYCGGGSYGYGYGNYGYGYGGSGICAGFSDGYGDMAGFCL